MARVPYVVRPLGTLTQYGVTRRRPWLKWLSLAVLEVPLLRHAAAVNFTSEGERDEVKPLNLPLRGVVIPFGRGAEDEAMRNVCCRTIRFWATVKIVLYLSHRIQKKTLNLLRAFAAIGVHQNNVALVMAGDGPPAYVGADMCLSARRAAIQQNLASGVERISRVVELSLEAWNRPENS